MFQPLILIGDFNHSDIYWKSSTANCKQSRKLTECVEGNFLVQVMESPTRGEKLLDQLLTKAEKPIRDVKMGSSPGCSSYSLVEFSILRGTRQIKSRVRTLKFRQVNFSLYRALVHGIPWETALRDKGANEIWEKKTFFLGHKSSQP